MACMWTPVEAANVWSLLVSFTDPNPQVQMNTLNQINSMNVSWAPLPYLLAEFLAHGLSTTDSAPSTTEEQKVAGQQAAGTLLKKMMAERVKSVKTMTEGSAPEVQFPQLDLSSFDVPLLFAICSGDRKVQMAGSGCLSQLVQYASEVSKLLAKNGSNNEGAAAAGNWIASLVKRLEQLCSSDVTNNHLGVSRCIGVLMEDRSQQLLTETRAAAGADTEAHASAALVQRLEQMTNFVVPIYSLLSFLIGQSNSFPAKLNALGCVSGITFVLGEPGQTGDSDEDEGEGLHVKGHSPSRGGAAAGASDTSAKAARANLAQQMYFAEKKLVTTVVQSLPIIVAEAQQGCDVTTVDGVKYLLDAFSASLSALTAIGSHWGIVQPLALGVLPTVLQWLAVFDWRQQAAKASIIGSLTIDPSLLQTCSFEAEALRRCCLDFITELSQQIEDNTTVSDALTLHHVAILQQLYAASVLDQYAVADVCVSADRHIPDSMHDVMFTTGKKLKGAAAEEAEDDEDETLLDDETNEDNNPFRCTSPTRTAAMFCFSAIALVLPSAFVFAVMDMLHPVVHKHLTAAESGQPSSDWLELEGALAFLAEALAIGAQTGDDDDSSANSDRLAAVAEQIAVICCRFLGAAQSAEAGGFTAVAPHFAGPVRAASARILARVGERLVYDSNPEEVDDDDRAAVDAYIKKAHHQNIILEAIVSVLYNTSLNDENKSVLCAAVGAYGAILQHSFVAQADDDDDLFDDDDDEEEKGAANDAVSELPFVHVSNVHISNFYSLTAHLTSMPLTQRVCYYKIIPDIAKADAEIMGKSSIFLGSVEAIFSAIVAAWGQLVTQLDCYESLSIGDLVCEMLQTLDKSEPHKQLPAPVARTLWNTIGLAVFQPGGLAQNLMNGIDTNGLTTETVSMAVDIMSSTCDTADPSVTCELFGSSGVAAMIASIVLPNLKAHSDDPKVSSATEELLRASLGLLGDFCSAVPPQQVHSVADALLEPIAYVIAQEALRLSSVAVAGDGRTATRTYAGGLKVTAAEVGDLFEGEEGGKLIVGNSLFCLCKLLDTVKTGDELVAVCPSTLGTAQQLQSFIGACVGLLKSLHSSSDTVGKYNVLAASATLGALFPAAVDAVGGDVALMREARTLASMDDPTNQMEIAVALGRYFSHSAGVQARAGGDIKARGQLLSTALALAPNMKKCITIATKGAPEDARNKKKKGSASLAGITPALVAMAQVAHGMWSPIVNMCQDAVNSAPSAKFSTTMKAAEKKLLQQVYCQ